MSHRLNINFEDKDEQTWLDMRSIVAQSAEYRSLNDYIRTAIWLLNKKYAQKDKS